MCYCAGQIVLFSDRTYGPAVTQKSPLEGIYLLYYSVSHWSVCLMRHQLRRVFGLHHFAPLEDTGCGALSSPELLRGAKGFGHVVKLPQTPQTVSPQEVCGFDVS